MAGIPIIGAPSPEQVAQLQQAQNDALEKIFHGAMMKAEEVMRQEASSPTRRALINLASDESVVNRVGMAAAALYAAQALLAPAVQVLALRMKRLEDENASLKASVADLERKVAPPS